MKSDAKNWQFEPRKIDDGEKALSVKKNGAEGKSDGENDTLDGTVQPLRLCHS